MPKKPKPKEVEKVEEVTEKTTRQIFGVAASMKNIAIAIVALVAFIMLFFNGYFYLEDRYAKEKEFQKLSTKVEYKCENDVLNGMYSRFHLLDQIFKTSPDPTKIDSVLLTEYNKLKTDIPKQEKLVTILQERLVCK